MKPILQYIQTTTFFKKTSIVQKQVDETHNINFIEKKELVDFVNSINPPSYADTVMYIKCGCNHEFIFTTIIDIPENNLNCVCGQKVIEYGS